MRIRCLRACVATVMLCAVAAVPPTYGVQPNIVNGTPTQAETTTGALLRRFGFGLGAICSGTLVGCRTFVTAAHCVCAGDTACQPDPKPLRVFLQHAGIFAVDRVDVHPSFDFGLRNDIAVLTLAEAVRGVEPAPINTTGTPGDGVAGTIVGFGVSRGTADDGGIKRRGTVAIAGCSAAPFPVPEPAHVCWVFDGPAGAAGSDSNTCAGDSGGPLFVDFGAGPVLAGVTSGGSSSDCLPDDVSFDTNVFENRSFLESTAGSDLGSSCGPLRQVGSSGVTVVVGGTATLTRETRACRKEVGKHTLKLIKAASKALRGCLDAVASGRAPGPCPDAKATLALERARANVSATKLARKCPQGVVEASMLANGCASATASEDVQTCVVGEGESIADGLVQAAYGDPSLAWAYDTDAAKCRKAAGSAASKLLTSRLRATSSCRGLADSGKVDGCPDSRAATKIERAEAKLASAIARSCDDAVVLGLAQQGAFGTTCSGVASSASLEACLAAAAMTEAERAEGMVAPVQAGERFAIDVPVGASELRVVLNAVDPAQASPNDVDLYLRFGQPASVTEFDAASRDGGVFEALVVADPAPGTWFAFVNEVEGSNVPFQVTATVFGP